MDNFNHHKTCKLCLCKISGNNFEILGDLQKYKLRSLLLDVKLDKDFELYLCENCSKHISELYKFKQSSLEANTDAGFVKPEIIPLQQLEDVLLNNNQLNNPENEDVPNMCCLCYQTDKIARNGKKKSSLYQIKESDLRKKIEKCFPELEYIIPSHPLLCKHCLNSLENLYKFINISLENQEKGIKYESSTPLNIKVETDELVSPGEIATNYSFLIKCEPEFVGIVEPVEEIDIKPCITEEIKEKSGLTDPFADTERKPSGTILKCEQCDYLTFNRYDLTRHMLRHKSFSEVPLYQCEKCDFKTKHRNNVKTHMVNHIDPSELKLFRCEHCAFTAKLKGNLTKHAQKHKSPLEVTTIRCLLCSYETLYRYNLKTHMLLHKKSPEIQMFHCPECSFETKYERYLKIHEARHKKTSEDDMILHNKLPEIPMFHCPECSFKTKYRKYLKTHAARHKTFSEEEMYKCGDCNFQSKHKRNLVLHIRNIHRKEKEIQKVELY